MPGAPPPADPPDPQALLRSRGYVQILILAAITGLPISAAAYGFLALVEHLQGWLFNDLPETLGYDAAPTWWPLPLLALSGVLTALAIRRLPGTGGHPPADGFKAAGALPPIELPGVLLAAFATLAFGAVLGPEAPLIAMGSGLGVLAVRLAARDAKPTVANVIAATGSFAAISSLLGSPLLGAFLLLEASGLGGAMLGLVLLPGLLAAGLGALIFLGLDSLSGLGALSLTIPNLPPFDHLTGAIFGWAIAFGLVAPFLGRGITLLAVAIRSRVEGRSVWLIAGARARDRRARDRLRRGDRQAGSATSCSPGRTRSARSSATRPAGRSGRSCCSCCARGSPTRSRSARSAAAPSSRRCSSARRAGSPPRTCPGCR